VVKRPEMDPASAPGGPALRKATAEDTPAIVRLVNLAYQGDPEGAIQGSWTSEADIVFGPRVTAAAVLTRIAAPDGVFLLQGGEGSDALTELAGCVYVERRGDAGHIGLLSVHPSAQSARLGTHLLRAAEAWTRESFGLGHAVVWVVSAREELAAWYQRKGYTRTAETHPFPPAEARVPGLFFVVMKKLLV